MATFRLRQLHSVLLTSRRSKIGISKVSQRLYSSSEELVKTSKDGPVFLICINRPERRNAVSIETGVQLKKAIHSFQEDQNARVAVLYGTDGVFCAGYDLQELSKGTDMPLDDTSVRDKVVPYAPMGPTKMMFTKPVIAAINGYAVAGGMELAMMCDMRVADQSTTFGIFCRRFGVPLLDGGSVRLPALIGLSRAMDLILTGRPITAVEAERYGLVNRVVPDGTALEHAIQLAKEISEFPQECMLADRKSAYHATYSSPSYDEALQFEHENGKPVVFKESVFGAKKFAADKVGRSGSFEAFKPK